MDMDFQGRKRPRVDAVHFAVVVCLPAVDKHLGKRRRHKNSENYGRISRVDGCNTFPVLCGVNPVQYFPKRQKPTFSSPPPVSDWSFVQFGWEFSLLIGGIRSAGIESAADKLTVLLVNSLLETNLGMPLIYIIFLLITSVFTEDLKRRGGKVTLSERLKENLAEGSLKAEKA